MRGIVVVMIRCHAFVQYCNVLALSGVADDDCMFGLLLAPMTSVCLQCL